MVEHRQSRFAWLTVYGVSGRKSTSRVKLKAASQEERLQKWKEYCKNLLEYPSEITDKRTEKIFVANYLTN